MLQQSPVLPIPWVPDEVWDARAYPERIEDDPEGALGDPIWRLANLYQIQDDQGARIPFVPLPEQRVIIWDILERGLTNLIIVKARRLGMSTVLCVLGADCMAFQSGFEVALVDKTKEDAVDKVRKFVRPACENLPPELRGVLYNPPRADNEDTYGLWSGVPGDIPSLYRAGVSFRGAGPNLLHISEWGTIQFEDAARSAEIKTGAMEAARRGIRIIETTWKGGKGGHVWDYVSQALAVPDDKKLPDDWHLRFFPWWVDERNQRDGDMGRIDQETNDYLDGIERELQITFTPGQRYWYYRAKLDNKGFMKRENPSTLEEAWNVPVEGAIYADAIEKLRGRRRILDFEIDKGVEVDTFWDLGSPIHTVVWYVQRNADGTADVIDCDDGLNLSTTERKAWMDSKGYTFACHYMPHDGHSTQKGGASFVTELQDAGFVNLRVVPRTQDIELGINRVQLTIPNLRFHAANTSTGVQHLSTYRRKLDNAKSITPTIVHDDSSHAADALRTMAEAMMAGMLSNNGSRRFDMQGLEKLRHKAALEKNRIEHGHINVVSRAATFEKDAPPDGWLSMAFRPQLGERYIIAYSAVDGQHQWGAVRITYPDNMSDDVGFELCACSNHGRQALDPDQAAERVAATAMYFGSCSVATVASDPEATWRALNRAGQDAYKRKRTALPSGGKSTDVIGWKDTDTLEEAFGILASTTREERASVFYEPALTQLEAFIRMPDGTEQASPGYGAEWVKILAIAVFLRSASIPFDPRARRAVKAGGDLWIPDYDDSGGEGVM